MEKLKKQSVGQIVADDYRAAKVFENYQIDFCCNGGRSLEDVANELDLNPEDLIEEIEQVQKDKSEGFVDYESWPLDLLADYIVKTHHRYSEKQIPVIKPYLAKIADVHGNRHPELFEIRDTFNQVAGKIAAHTKKEEIMVFPFIKRMANAKETGSEFKNPKAKTVEDPVNMLKEEHDDQGEAFRKIAQLSNNFTMPADGCNTYRVSFGLLKEFQQDLFKHIHLENNILFPKAIELEKELTA